MENWLKFEDREQMYGSLLRELNLQKIEEIYHANRSEDYFIKFSAKKFLIRYINDRHHLFLEVASNSAPSKWMDLKFIKNFMQKAKELNPDMANDLKEITELNEFLKVNFDEIAQLLSENNYQNTFGQISTLLKAEFIRKHPGKVQDSQ